MVFESIKKQLAEARERREARELQRRLSQQVMKEQMLERRGVILEEFRRGQQKERIRLSRLEGRRAVKEEMKKAQQPRGTLAQLGHSLEMISQGFLGQGFAKSPTKPTTKRKKKSARQPKKSARLPGFDEFNPRLPGFGL